MVSGAWSVSSTNLAPIKYFLNLLMPQTTANPSRSDILYHVSLSQNFLLANVTGKRTDSCSCKIHAAIPTSDASVRITKGFSRSGSFRTGSESR